MTPLSVRFFQFPIISYFLVRKRMEVAILGGGCFWCIEALIQRLKGVEKVTSGYCGSDLPNPKY